MELWFALLLAAAHVGSAASGLGLMLLRLRRVAPSGRKGRAAATVILPVTGEVPQLGTLLAALDRQRLRPRRVLVVVESEADPAFARASAARGRRGVPVEVVVAGPSADGGQKCLNLAAGLRRLDEGDEAVVLMDADIEPQPFWLATLLRRLDEDGVAIASGYRWMRAASGSPVEHALVAIDRGYAVLPRPAWSAATWGGSTAMAARTPADLGLPEALSRALSDDATAGRLARERGLSVAWPAAALLPTPFRADAAGAWRFLHRQAQIVRLHWPLPFWLEVANGFGKIGLLATLAATAPAGVTAGALVAAAGLRIATARAAAAISARIRAPDEPSHVRGQMAAAALRPLIDAVFLVALLAATASRTVRWAHVTYRVAPDGSVRVLARRPFAAAAVDAAAAKAPARSDPAGG